MVEVPSAIASLLLLQRLIVLPDEIADLLRHPQQLLPLLAIEGDRKRAQGALSSVMVGRC
jgi:hypothetical protein